MTEYETNQIAYEHARYTIRIPHTHGGEESVISSRQGHHHITH